MTQNENSFASLGLAPAILKSASRLGFTTPTPIQRKAIPLVLQGRDIMGLAQTGTGKTAAFGLPLVHHLMSNHDKRQPKSVRALILAPTRELVNQIATNLRDYVRGGHLNVQSVVGGASIGLQIRNLSRGTDVLVATPGRLLDLLDRRALTLSDTKFLVLDEADQMLDLGFIHALRKIAALVGTPRQTLLFSATMPKQMAELASTYLSDPVRVETAPPGKAADKVRQSVHFVDQRGKTDLLKSLLAQRPDDLSLVFSRTKHGAEKLMKQLVATGFAAGSVHGNKSQNQRERAIKAFRNGSIRVLVATDVAARGIDIPGVSHVYNYDLPEVPENYVHRIGRTARAGSGGQAVAFCKPEDVHLLRAVEKLMGMEISVAGGDVPADMPAPSKAKKRSRPKRNRNAGKPDWARKEASGNSGAGQGDAGHGDAATAAAEPGRKGKPPARAKSGQQKPAKGKKPYAGKPNTSKPRSGKPGAGKPVSGKPASGKPAAGRASSSKRNGPRAGGRAAA
ncbi:DEAD/DEAH box helicase [Parvularcula sp. IMCC14364]|uniref:DEAD/DEAH box helicase n=1 Tax=Parvularcula sp. IMCC14364 TaxID=3067902 RepID=UPI002740B1C3|nr:DEAD/DEAH box helicase [Parvularcula sp. IMCC14364]